MCMFRLIFLTQSYSGGRGTFGMSTMFVQGFVSCSEARQLRHPDSCQSVVGGWCHPVFTLLFFFAVLFSHIVPFCITYTYKEAAVWHQTVIEKRDYNASCWCVCYSGFQSVPQVALNYYLSHCWKQVRQCWQTYCGVTILNLKGTISVCFFFCYTVQR